jgi:hypothetical protein
LLDHISPYSNKNSNNAGTTTSSTSPSSSSSYKLSIFSGHDTVIAPVLAALGVYKDRLCRWPQYASRIIFEVYELTIKNTENPRIDNNIVISAAKDYLKRTHHYHTERIRSRIFHSSSSSSSAASPSSFPLSSSEIEELIHLSREKYFLRVLFNGEDITELIPTCQEERLLFATAIANSQYLVDSENWIFSLLTSKIPLCTIGSFTKQIKSMILPHKTIHEACK